ncbi:retrotransposon protein, putative, ty1-copia subclass [Tanacetum coccineum]
MLAELRKCLRNAPAVEIYDLVECSYMEFAKQAPVKQSICNAWKTVSDLHAAHYYEKGFEDKETSRKKGRGKADKNKQVSPSQPKPNPKKRKENPNKDQACHHCHMTGHWKRNCPLYLEELRANKKKSEHSAAVQVWRFSERTQSSRFQWRDWDLEDDHIDTLPTENTSEMPVELKVWVHPPDLIPVRRSVQAQKHPTDSAKLGVSMDRGKEKSIKSKKVLDCSRPALPMPRTVFLYRLEVKHDLSNEMCASSDEEKAYMKKVPYASAVGSIMYAVRCTRPDVAFAQNLVSVMRPGSSDKDDTKSQTGYVFVINGGAVDWKSKKQTTIAMPMRHNLSTWLRQKLQ